MLLAVLIIIGCVLFALRFWMKPRRLLLPPMYPGALPIIGHGHIFIGDFQHVWNTEKKMYEYSLQNGEPVEVRLGPHSMYVITDPDDTLTVANKCLEKPYVYNFGKEMYGSGLTTADVSVWKPHRKLLNPLFNQQVMPAFVEEFIIHSKSLVSLLASEVGKGPFDVYPYMTDHFMEIACRTTLGLKTDKNSAIVKKYSEATEAFFAGIMERMQRIWLHNPYIFNWSSYKKKQDTHMKVLKDITEAVITSKKSDFKLIGTSYKTPEQASEKLHPILHRMLDLADKQGAFTDGEIREHLDTFIAGAYDTTALSTTFTLILIGSHQNVQERIYRELQEVLGNEDRDLNRHDLPKLVYLEAVIKESLRMYPPIPRIGRTSSSDVYLKNHILPANCSYSIPLYALNRHSSWGADAYQFRPERWLDPATLPKNPTKLASFGLGRRNCIGKLYGMLAVKVTLAHFLRRYLIKSDIENLVTRCDAFLKPMAGHHISLESRI